jgi:hypothetical protein
MNHGLFILPAMLPTVLLRPLQCNKGSAGPWHKGFTLTMEKYALAATVTIAVVRSEAQQQHHACRDHVMTAT